MTRGWFYRKDMGAGDIVVAVVDRFYYSVRVTALLSHVIVKE